MCYKCGISGHVKAQCTERNGEDQQTSSNVEDSQLENPQNATSDIETTSPSASAHLENDTQNSTSECPQTKPHNQTVQGDGQMVLIGVAGT